MVIVKSFCVFFIAALMVILCLRKMFWSKVLVKFDGRALNEVLEELSSVRWSICSSIGSWDMFGIRLRIPTMVMRNTQKQYMNGTSCNGLAMFFLIAI